MATQNYFKAKNGLEAPSQSTIAVTDSNFPTVRPTLNLDFAGSESVDSRITFTRASTATYYGADGKLAYAAQNEPRIEYDPATGECKGLLIEEQRTNLCVFDSALNINWALNACTAKPNAAIAPDGSMSADQLVTLPASSGSNNAYTYPASGTMTAGTVYTYSVYVKSAGVNFIFLQGVQAGGFAKAYFNLSTGTLSTVPVQYTASMKACGNGWYRCSITFTCDYVSSSVLALGMASTDSIGIVGDASSGVYVWGAQLEAGAFPTSYIPTTPTFTSRASAATYFDSTGTLRIAGTNQARYGYGYDSTSGKWVSQGLILENAATNLLLYSAIQSSQWSIGSGSVTYNSAVAPDGTNTALTYTCSADVDHIYKALDYAPLAGTNTRIVFSVWVKGTAGQTIRTRILTSGGTSADAETYTTLNGQWQRVEVSGITGTTYTYVYPYDRRTGVGTATNIQIWGGQVETGYVATSYIPTYGAAATRAADVSSSASATRAPDDAQMLKINTSWFNWQEGTLYAEGTYASANSGSFIGITPDNVNTWILGMIELGEFNVGTSLLRIYTSIGGATATSQSDTTVSALTTNTYHKMVGAWSSTSAATTVNGGTVVTTYNPILQSNHTTLKIGASYDILRKNNGYIKRILYFPKRLTGAQLQALTS